MSNKLAIKRIGAYFIDFLVISIISAGLARISFLNPKYDEYSEASTAYNSLINDYYAKEITINEFSEQSKELGYEMNKNGEVYIISGIIITILYYSGFAYWTQGQTLGKKLFHIKIVRNKDEKNPKIYSYFIRCFILNGLILSILTIIALRFSKSTYFEIYNIGTNIDSIILIIIFLMVMFTKDGRGLHDILAGTKVVDVKNEVEEVKVIKKSKKEEPADE